MADPFLGEIRIVGFNFAPLGWALCDGQLMPISQNTALFSLLGTMYGGDGRTTFGLPNLQGRVAMHRSQIYVEGEVGGSTTLTLLSSELPSHPHTMQAFEGRGRPAHGDPAAGDALTAAADGAFAYVGSDQAVNTQMNPQELTFIGGGQPHDNMMPSLVLNYCIALQGIYPERG